MDNTTRDLLNFDPLDYAERLTGESCHTEATGMLGMALAMNHNRIKNEHLKTLGDTTYGDKLDRYTQIITEMGFEQVLDLPFTGKSYNGDDPREEHYFIYAHRDGLLLSFDTFGGNSVNGGKVCYCWKPSGPANQTYGLTSSGCFRNYDSPDRYWAGDHDCREALQYKLNALRENGTFLQKWPADHNIFLWLLHYMDTKVDGYDYKAITAERLAMLPDWVQEMIGR